MKQSLETKLRQFENNRKAVEKSALLQDSRIAAASACLFSLNDQEFTVEDIKEARAVLKSKAGVFSNFRGQAETPVVCALAGSSDPVDLIERSMAAYKMLKKKFVFGEYLPVAAIMTAQSVDENMYGEIADRTERIFKLIKKDHPFLTGQEDELMCVLLALQNASEEQLAADCEYCYKRLKDHFGAFASGDGIQSLCEVLAASGGDLEEKCQRAIDLYGSFKENKSAITNGYELGALGALAILPVSVDLLVEQVLEVSEELKKQRGYGVLGLDRRSRMIHAALLTAADYADDESGVIAAIQGTISAIIAEEIMIICIISSTHTSTTSSN